MGGRLTQYVDAMPTQPFSVLRAALFTRSPESRARLLSLVVGLRELRARRGVTQTDLAERMHTAQSAVSRLERQHDVRLLTLYEYVHALGGQLRLVALFDDDVYELQW